MVGAVVGEPHRAAPVLTVGHSTRPLEEFLQLLRAHSVDLVCDVRRYPASRRHPQFGGETLAGALAGAGIGYRHVPTLGGRRSADPHSSNLGWRNTAFRGYADHMQTQEFAGGLEDLLDLAGEQRVAIMCSEALPWRCHRSLIADALIASGTPVLDILGLQDARPHRLTPFARVLDHRVTYPSAS